MLRFINKLSGLFLIVLLFLFGCDQPKENLADGVAPGHELPEDPPEPGPKIAFALTVETAWESAKEKRTQHQRREIPEDAARGEITECVAKIPEGQLYYSELILTASTATDTTCDTFVFRPYYYTASISKTFAPPWTNSPVDCSELSKAQPDFSKAKKDCYGGPAKQLVTTFPRYTGLYHLTAESNAATYRIPSGNSIQYRSNRWTSNSLPAAQRNQSLQFSTSDTYIANTFADYIFECKDKFEEELFTFRLTVEDVDIKAGDPIMGDPNHISHWTGGTPFDPLAEFMAKAR